MSKAEGQHRSDFMDMKLGIIGIIGIIGKNMLKMELPGGRLSAKPKRRSMDVIREDMQIAGLREHAEDRKRWRRMIHSGESKKNLGKAK